jgi:hypothetical protein
MITTIKNVESNIAIANHAMEYVGSRYRLVLRTGYGQVGVDYATASQVDRHVVERCASPLLSKRGLYDWLGAFIAGLDAASQK